jgi:hypothetical protein
VSEPKLLATLTVDDFAPHVGQAFQVAGGGAAVALSLASAQASRHSASPARQGFALVFVGEASLGQGIHTVVHPELGALDIFLVPIGPGPQGLQYEAIFN